MSDERYKKMFDDMRLLNEAKFSRPTLDPLLVAPVDNYRIIDPRKTRERRAVLETARNSFLGKDDVLSIYEYWNFLGHLAFTPAEDDGRIKLDPLAIDFITQLNRVSEPLRHRVIYFFSTDEEETTKDRRLKELHQRAVMDYSLYVNHHPSKKKIPAEGLANLLEPDLFQVDGVELYDDKEPRMDPDTFATLNSAIALHRNGTKNAKIVKSPQQYGHVGGITVEDYTFYGNLLAKVTGIYQRTDSIDFQALTEMFNLLRTPEGRKFQADSQFGFTNMNLWGNPSVKQSQSILKIITNLPKGDFVWRKILETAYLTPVVPSITDNEDHLYPPTEEEARFTLPTLHFQAWLTHAILSPALLGTNPTDDDSIWKFLNGLHHNSVAALTRTILHQFYTGVSGNLADGNNLHKERLIEAFPLSELILGNSTGFVEVDSGLYGYQAIELLTKRSDAVIQNLRKRFGASPNFNKLHQEYRFQTAATKQRIEAVAIDLSIIPEVTVGPIPSIEIPAHMPVLPTVVEYVDATDLTEGFRVTSIQMGRSAVYPERVIVSLDLEHSQGDTSQLIVFEYSPGIIHEVYPRQIKQRKDLMDVLHILVTTGIERYCAEYVSIPDSTTAANFFDSLFGNS